MMTEITWGKRLPVDRKMYGHSPVQYGRGPNGRHYGSAFIRTYVHCECGTRCSGQGEEGGLRSYQRHLLHKKPEIEQAKLTEANIQHIRKVVAERYRSAERVIGS